MCKEYVRLKYASDLAKEIEGSENPVELIEKAKKELKGTSFLLATALSEKFSDALEQESKDCFRKLGEDMGMKRTKWIFEKLTKI